MATTTASITTTADDGYWYVGLAGFNQGSVYCGDYFGAVAAFLRFALDVPPGATVTAASLTLTASAGLASGRPGTKIHAVAEDDPVAVSGATDADSRSLTSASVSWSPSAWVASTAYTSPNLAAVVQEVLGRPGWSAGNHIMLMWLPVGSPSQRFQAVDYSSSAANAASLSVTYTPPPTGVTGTAVQSLPSVTQSAAVTVTVPSGSWR